MALVYFAVHLNAPVNAPPANGSFVESATVMFAEPSKDTPFIVLAVASLVAVAALQAKFPVAVLAHAVVAIFVELSATAGVGADVTTAPLVSHPMLIEPMLFPEVAVALYANSAVFTL